MTEFTNKQEEKNIYLKHDRIKFWTKWSEGKKTEENAEMISHFEELSKIDSLTKTLNHGALKEEINKIDLISKDQETHLLVIFADVDNLRKTNATLGHLEGSKRIENIANMLKQAINTGDIIGRYGGDEFLIFIQEYDEERFDIHLKKLQEALSGKESVSIGHKFWNSAKDGSLSKAIEEADKNMYQVKNSLPDHSGRIDGIEVFELD